MASQSIHLLARDPVDTAARIPPPRRRWLTRIGLPLLIVMVTAGLLAFAARDLLLPATQVHIVRTIAKTIDVDHASISAAPGNSPATGTGTVIAQAPGWVEPAPFAIRVPALTDGTIGEVLVLEGDAVKPTQVVAKMIDDEAKLAVRKAQAEVARRQSTLDAAQAEWDNPVARERAVAVGKEMVAESQAEVAQIEAMTRVEQAKLDELEGFSRRLGSLPEGLVEMEKVERAKFQTAGQRASVEALVKQRLVVEAKARRYAVELKAAEKDLVLRITEKQSLADAKAMHQEALAALDEAKLREERMEIKSPAAGVVMVRHVAPGSRMMLSGNDADSAYVVELYDPLKLQVRADVPLGDAAKIGVGQQAQVIVDVLPDRVFTGKVTRLVHQADIGKNTIQVKVAIDEPSPLLKPEMLARVKFLSQPSNDRAQAMPSAKGGVTALRVFVPESVVHQDRAGATVWTVDAATNTAKRKAITLGTTKQEGWIETVAGLNPGDAVIAQPHELREGERVRITSEIENFNPQ